jgi:hypothetical protein
MTLQYVLNAHVHLSLVSRPLRGQSRALTSCNAFQTMSVLVATPTAGTFEKAVCPHHPTALHRSSLWHAPSKSAHEWHESRYVCVADRPTHVSLLAPRQTELNKAVGRGSPLHSDLRTMADPSTSQCAPLSGRPDDSILAIVAIYTDSCGAGRS